MSAQQAAFNAANTGKKAVHVKWAGKTIALGTFPSSEADEKCARAKALTRAWRSTMRPKPTREWVMMELERLGVRVVSGRLGRKAGEDGDESLVSDSKKMMGAAGIGASPPVERSGSIGWGTDADITSLMASRRSSIGLSMGLNDGRRGSLGSLGQVVGLDSGDPMGMRGGFDVGPDRRASSLGLGGLGNMGMSVNPNQHYEMLKLHHMNLLNEIQETTLMMNLYQQQQLQQQQQQLQQQANAEALGAGGDLVLPQIDSMFQQRGSLGLGGGGLGSFGSPSLQMMQQHQPQALGQQMSPNLTLGGDQPGIPGNKDTLNAVAEDNAAKLSSSKRPAENNETDNKEQTKRIKSDGNETSDDKNTKQE